MNLQILKETAKIKVFIVLFHIFMFLLLAIRYYLDEIRNGGNIWTTADWFVSYQYGFVRRGAIGTLIELLTSNQKGAFLLISTFLLLHIIVGFYFILVCRIFLCRIDLGKIPLIVLMISPIYISFWLVNPLAYLRKEILALLAVSYAAYCVVNKKVSRRNYSLILGFWILAILSHESALLVTPILLMFLLHQFKQNILKRNAMIIRTSLLILIPSSLIAILNEFRWLSPEFCSYLVSRNLSEKFCNEGGIAWAMRPEWYTDFMTNVSQNIAFYTPDLIIFFLFMMLPLFILGDINCVYLTIILLIISTPLFLTTYDWGRWLFVIGSSLILYTLATTKKKISSKEYLLLTTLLPTYLLIQLPYCCSVSPFGGLLNYFVSVFRVSLL